MYLSSLCPYYLLTLIHTTSYAVFLSFSLSLFLSFSFSLFRSFSVSLPSLTRITIVFVCLGVILIEDPAMGRCQEHRLLSSDTTSSLVQALTSHSDWIHPDCCSGPP